MWSQVFYWVKPRRQGPEERFIDIIDVLVEEKNKGECLGGMWWRKGNLQTPETLWTTMPGGEKQGPEDRRSRGQHVVVGA